jgi:hypothetical protein
MREKENRTVMFAGEPERIANITRPANPVEWPLIRLDLYFLDALLDPLPIGSSNNSQICEQP